MIAANAHKQLYDTLTGWSTTKLVSVWQSLRQSPATKTQRESGNKADRFLLAMPHAVVAGLTVISSCIYSEMLSVYDSHCSPFLPPLPALGLKIVARALEKAHRSCCATKHA